MLCLNLLELQFDLWSPLQASEWFAQNHYDLHIGIASTSLNESGDTVPIVLASPTLPNNIFWHMTLSN